MCGFVCVNEKKNISWNLICVFFVHCICIFVHISVLACESINALDLNESVHFMCAGLTAA